MATFTALEIINVVLFIFNAEPGNSKFYILGYLQTFIHVLSLVAIPLLIAAKHRDKIAIHQMPIAGQILGTISAFAIVVPASIAPTIDKVFLKKQHNALAA
jgi:hypothetical protein